MVARGLAIDYLDGVTRPVWISVRILRVAGSGGGTGRSH